MDRTSFQRVLRRAVIVPLAFASILIVTLVLQVESLQRRAEWVQHSQQVIGLADRIYRTRVDQETGLRAFLLTRDQRFLEPFFQGRDQSRELESVLRGLIADPEQQKRNEAAIQANLEWYSWALEAMKREEAGADVSSAEFQLQGKTLMDRYRALRAEFINREERLREERLGRSEAAFRQVRWAVVGLCLVLAVISAALERKQLWNLSSAFGQALDEARTQHEWLRTTLTSIGDGVIASDVSGAIVFMNPVAESLTGWTSREARGRPLIEVFRVMNEQTREPVESPVDKIRRLNGVAGLANHTILIKKSGEEFAIDDSGAPILDSHGIIAGFVLVFRDVTKQRGLEAALRSNERLALAGRLSASIAHEINNPLNSVDNLLFLINQQAQGQARLQELATMAQNEVHRVAQISKNMLSLHRESRRPLRVKVSELLDGVVALIEETVAKGRRTIRVEHGFTGEIKSFPAELRQVFTNVLKNAVEATGEGGEIVVSSFSAQEDGKRGVRVQVADNGVGIPKSVISKLFTPFVTTKEESGTGLGLWVSRSILERHGGSISISSGVDLGRQGTIVSIFLPLDDVAPHVAVESAGQAQNAERSTTAEIPRKTS